MDRAEIEWGDLFIERLAEGIQNSSDFVLFWSKASSQSNWVQLELHMAFIRKMEGQAIRLRVVKLDDTEMPLSLKPYQSIDVTNNPQPATAIVDNLKTLLRQAVSGVRHRFLNRNYELGKVETAIDDPESFLIVLEGFQGIGKSSLARESMRRFFSGSDPIQIDVVSGTRLIELALRLCAESKGKELPVGLSSSEAKGEILLALESLASEGKFLIFTNIQHWFDEDARPVEPLISVLEGISKMPEVRKRPVLMTSTRRGRFGSDFISGITQIHIQGLSDQYVGTLLRMWHELIEGETLSHDKAGLLARQLHGHPIAAKLAAGLVAQYGVDHLLDYPEEIISLRRDLASTLIRDVKLSDQCIQLLEALALLNVPVPAAVLTSGVSLDNASFQDAVQQATQSGLIELRKGLELHPLLQDYYWRTHLHREDYKTRASQLAKAVWEYASTLQKSSVEFSVLLPATVRLYFLSGQISEALKLRSDLYGELAHAAITHYDRRNYELADRFIQHVLDMDPTNWQMRLYRGRILIRQQRWGLADKLLEEMSTDRSNDMPLKRLIGWRHLRAREYEQALSILNDVIATKPYYGVALRDAAECLHKLDRDDEALIYLERAKKAEYVNPYALDLEAMILERRGQLDEAYDAALLAAVRQPRDWGFHHRLGRIRVAQGKKYEAIGHFEEAIKQDPSQFTPLNSLVSLLLDMNDTDKAKLMLENLRDKARTPIERSIERHLWARYHRDLGQLDKATDILEAEIKRNQNLIPNLGLMADIRIAQHDRSLITAPALAAMFLKQAENAILQCEATGKEDERIIDLKKRLAERLQ